MWNYTSACVRVYWMQFYIFQVWNRKQSYWLIFIFQSAPVDFTHLAMAPRECFITALFLFCSEYILRLFISHANTYTHTEVVFYRKTKPHLAPSQSVNWLTFHCRAQTAEKLIFSCFFSSSPLRPGRGAPRYVQKHREGITSLTLSVYEWYSKKKQKQKPKCGREAELITAPDECLIPVSVGSHPTFHSSSLSVSSLTA